MAETQITSRHNPKLKRTIKLREGRGRRESGLLLVDGAREVLRALQVGIEPVEAFLDVKHQGERTRSALEELEKRNVPIVTVASDPFAKLAFGDRADGLILVAKAAPHTLDDLQLPENPLVVVVEGIEKPGNLGAILRTADGVGVDAVIVADSRVDLYNPNTIRASIGTIFRSGIAVTTAAEARDWLLAKGIQMVAATPESKTPYHEQDLSIGTAIVLGSEALGLSDTWKSDSVQAVSLPMHGVADSLNVSVTAAVLLYESLRQRSV